jgi:hypothetical protein
MSAVHCPGETLRQRCRVLLLFGRKLPYSYPGEQSIRLPHCERAAELMCFERKDSRSAENQLLPDF